jgi:hypothetical protein
MIDDDVLQTLINVDSDAACLVSEGVAYVHSPHFVLELPEENVKRVKWPGVKIKHIVQWQGQLPRGGLLKTTAVNMTTATGKACMRLMSLTTSDSRLLQRGYYDFFRDQLDDAQFKIMTYDAPPGEVSGIAIFDGDRWVGAVGAYLPDSSG